MTVPPQVRADAGSSAVIQSTIETLQSFVHGRVKHGHGKEPVFNRVSIFACSKQVPLDLKRSLQV
jgi:hypothetical protein